MQNFKIKKGKFNKQIVISRKVVNNFFLLRGAIKLFLLG